MKIKGDFITNSSSTNYVVNEYFRGVVTHNEFFNQFSELVKKFFDHVKELYKDSAGTPTNKIQLKAKMDEGYMEFEAEHPDEMIEVKTQNDVYLYGLKTAIESIGSDLIVHFKYTANQEAKEVDEAMKFIVRQIFQDVFDVDEIDVRHTREIVDFHGDGWDGGDPCFGHYGESDLCKSEVEVKENIVM